MIRFGLLLALLAPLAAAEPVLFDAAAADALALVTANEPAKAGLSVFSLVVDKGAALQVACKATPTYPGIALKPPKPWNLAACAWVEATLANPSDHPVSVVMRLDNAGDWKSNPWNGEVVAIPAGQSAKLRVWFGRSWGQAGFALDAARITQVLLFLSQPKVDGTFLVRRIVAGGHPSDKP